MEQDPNFKILFLRNLYEKPFCMPTNNEHAAIVRFDAKAYGKQKMVLEKNTKAATVF